MKHINGVSACPRCEDKLKDAHADLAEWFRDKVKPRYPQAHVSWSYRGQDDQERAFLDGKSKLHFPLSAHNKSDDQGHPCALALDLFQLSDDGVAVWPWKFFYAISVMASRDKAPIGWGGLWTHLGDADHFELKTPSS